MLKNIFLTILVYIIGIVVVTIVASSTDVEHSYLTAITASILYLTSIIFFTRNK